MSEAFSLARLEAQISQAAQDGTAEAAARFAEILRANGEHASVTAAPDGTAQIVLEGAGAVAREFGTRKLPPRPLVADSLSANRREIRESIARKIAEALRGARS